MNTKFQQDAMKVREILENTSHEEIMKLGMKRIEQDVEKANKGYGDIILSGILGSLIALYMFT